MSGKRTAGIFAQIILAANGMLQPAAAQTPEPAKQTQTDPQKIIALEARYAEDLKTGALNDFLRDAVWDHDLDAVRFLLGKGVDPDGKYRKDGSLIDQSPLMTAALNNDAEIVHELLKAGANVNRQNSIGKTALMQAIEKGSYTTIDELLMEPHLDLYATDKTGSNILYQAVMYAMFEDDVETLKKLLDHGAGVLVNSRSGDSTPFSNALDTYMELPEQREVLFLLATAGGNPDTTRGGEANVTILHDAAHNGNVPVIRILAGLGANLNAVTGPHNDPRARRDTPLMWAAQNGQTRAIQEILSYKVARIEDRNNLGQTALMMAAAGGHTDAVIQLLNYGAQIDDVDNSGNSALALAQKLQASAPRDDPDFLTRLQQTIGLLKDVTNGKPVPAFAPIPVVEPPQPPDAAPDDADAPAPMARNNQRFTAFSRA